MTSTGIGWRRVLGTLGATGLVGLAGCGGEGSGDGGTGGDSIANETDIETVWIDYADYSSGQDVRTNYARVFDAGRLHRRRAAAPQGYGEDWEGQLDEAGPGPFTSRYHWNQYDNEIDSAFVDFYTSQYGIYPDLFSGGFVSTAAIHEAVQAGGSTNQDDVRETLGA